VQALQQGSAAALLAAAAATRNSMCGLYPLAVALEALYGTDDGAPAGSSSSGGGGGGGASSSSSSSSSACSSERAGPPQLLDYRPAHAIFARPDSTGFAALAVYSSSGDASQQQL
jgi:hypothetical protein